MESTAPRSHFVDSLGNAIVYVRHTAAGVTHLTLYGRADDRGPGVNTRQALPSAYVDARLRRRFDLPADTTFTYRRR